MGILEAKKKEIFHRFQQVNTEFKGSGLGLSIVKFIVEMHNGDISLKSEYGKGSEFFVSLPAYKLSEEEEQLKTRNIKYEIDKINLEFSEL
jgi:two-component system CheB/CheR fusion protein